MSRVKMEYKQVPTSEGGITKTGGGSLEMVWRGINIIMAVFFILATAANLNDSDWYLWVPIYLLPAILCIPVIFNPNLSENRILGMISVVHLTLCLAYTVYQVVVMAEAVSGRLDNPLQHEEGRELGGLLIIITWLGMCRFTSLGRPQASSSNKSLMNALLLMSITLAILPLFTWAVCFVGDWHERLGHCKGMFIK